jgi:hypothetical protein
MLTGTSEAGRATELQVQIDDVHACLGQCAGCVLAQDERKGKVPDMDGQTLELAVERMVEHARSMRPLKRVNVTFAIADHILMGKDYLKRIHDLGSRIVRAGEPASMEYSGVFFTTSLVGKPDKVMAMLRELRAEIEGDVPFIPLVVLDGRIINATKFGAQWREMVLLAKSLFGKVDLNTNLSVEAIGMMTPDELADFADGNGFDDVTVNWSPTLANAAHTLSDNKAMADWLIAFDDLSRSKDALTTGYGQYIDRVVENAARDAAAGGLPNLADYVRSVVPETIRKSVEIDHRGNLLAKFEAVGDIPHAPRHGFAPLGHIRDGSVADILDRGAKKMIVDVVSIHSRGSCVTCRYNAVCAVTGFHVATKVGRTTAMGGKEGCPHVAFPLIEKAFERLAAAGGR